MWNKKNILYVGGFELPDKNAAAQRVIVNGKLFSKLGYNVYYVGVDKNAENDKSTLKANVVDGFQYYSNPQEYPKSKKAWFKFITDISFVKDIIKRDLKDKVEIIVAYNYPAISLWKLIRYCKKNNIKIVTDVTEWYQPDGNFLFRIVKGFDTYLRMNILQKKVDGVITISTYLSEFYKEQNVIQLPPLVDKDAHKWGKVVYEPTNYCKLIYVGSPGNGQKDRLDVIILSLARIKERVRDFKFKIIGITEYDYLESFGIGSIPENIKINLLFEGRKSHEEVISGIKNSDYSIFLRNINLVNTAGFPTKFVESITCGTPVLTNRTSNISQYLVEGKLGFLLNNDSEINLDKTLARAINEPKEKIETMKDNCINYYDFHFGLYEDKLSYFLSRV